MSKQPTIDKCPICGHEVEEYHEVTFKEPYIHNNPFDGLAIYGAYTAPKAIICHENNYFHFAFYNAEGELVQHRLVKLGVEHPATKSPSEEYMDGITGDDYEDDNDERDEHGQYFYDDDEDFPHGSLDY
jgi:hypothetical protein